MKQRDRSEGWKYAKLSGHAFEEKFIREVIKEDSEIHQALQKTLLRHGISENLVSAEDIGTTKMESIFGGRKTSAKADCTLYLEDGREVGISLKKPSTRGGQLHLTSLERFVNCFTHYGHPIPHEAYWALRAFTGETNGIPISQFAPRGSFTGPRISRYDTLAEIHQNRLYASTLMKYYEEEWNALEHWFSSNMKLLTEIAFSRGYCSDTSGYVDFIFYGCNNLFLSIDELTQLAAKETIKPSSNGYYAGSTILMPWGFLQVHRPGRKNGPYQLQFHHQLDAILRSKAN